RSPPESTPGGDRRRAAKIHLGFLGRVNFDAMDQHRRSVFEVPNEPFHGLITTRKAHLVDQVRVNARSGQSRLQLGRDPFALRLAFSGSAADRFVDPFDSRLTSAFPGSKTG